MIARKPRSDSRLKTLLPSRQEQIADYASSHSLEETKTWLGEDGVRTSTAALSEFLSWWALKQQLSRNETTVESVLEQLKRSRPDLTEEDLFAAGQSFFSALAIEQRDAKTWKRTQDLKFKAQVLKFEREKFEFNAARAALEALDGLKAIRDDKGLDADGKINAARAQLFGLTPE